MGKPSGFARLKQPDPPPEPLPAPAPAQATQKKQPGREGMKTVIFYDDPRVVRALKQVGLNNDLTLQQMLHEAVDDYLVKNGMHAFGPAFGKRAGTRKRGEMPQGA